MLKCLLAKENYPNRSVPDPAAGAVQLNDIDDLSLRST